MVVFLLLAMSPFLLRGQTNSAAASAPAPNAQVARELAFLTPAQQLQYAKAHQKALENNPGLKSEGEDLIQQARALTPNSPGADKQAVLEKMNSHRQKLRAAMLKEDPTLSPVFKEIDQHISQMRAQNSGATPAPAAH
jgi:uncharacterized protein YkwD